MALALAALGASASLSTVSGTATAVTPVQKVIQLLGDMAVKAKAAKADEEVAYSKFQQFCTNTQANKQAAVARGTEAIETLTAEVANLDQEAATLGRKVAELEGTIATADADIKAAKEQRQKDSDNNKAEIDDLAESVDALERAISTIKRKAMSQTQEQVSLEQQLATSPKALREHVLSLLAMRASDDGDGNSKEDFLMREGPKAKVYEAQSGSLLELLERLRDEFVDKLSEAQKGEMNSKHAFKMLTQDLTDTIENAKSDSSSTSSTLQEKKELSANGKARLARTTSERDAAASFLKELQQECEEKGKSFEEKQQLREDEIKAIEQAVSILGSPDVAGAAEAHLPVLAQQDSLRGVSLAQLRNGGADGGPSTENARKALASFLSNAGGRLHSKRLDLLATRVADAGEPFGKVKKMIKDLISRLLEEAGQETEQKGWCDKEMRTNGQTRSKLQADIERVSAEIDNQEALLTRVGQRSAEAAAEREQLEKELAEATQLRSTEKAKNEATVADAVAAQKAIQAAVGVLQEFYMKAGKATAFLQTNAQEPVRMDSVEWESLANPDFKGTVDRGHREGMQTFGDTYKGLSDEAGGVFAMLEVIASDFASLQASTQAAEANAVREYKELSASSRRDTAALAKESDLLASDAAAAKTALASLGKERGQLQDQLLAADRYHEKLKPQCVDSGMTFEERQKAREAEIQSLKEALEILKGTDFRA